MTNTLIQRKEWLKLVAEEIEAIKQNADAIEKLALTMKTFNPHSNNNCIYGQMTGGCRSERAIELIMRCCKGYVINFGNKQMNKIRTSHEEINVYENINLKGNKIGYFSNLESYIFTSSRKINSKILGYIKGHTDKFPQLI